MYHPELIHGTVLEVLGTMLSCQLACQYGLSSYVAGGTHHAKRDNGAGYTILNDLVICNYQKLRGNTELSFSSS